MRTTWEQDWETRPLLDRSVFSIPGCRLHPQDGSPCAFRQNVVRLGSAPDNDLVLEHATVSREHARIQRHGDGYLLCDLDSTNGTFLNGVRIREAWLQPGCTITLGTRQIAFSPADEQLQVDPSPATRLGDLVGNAPAMRRLFRLVEQVAPTDATVLIQGETGTGKEIVARTLHQFSRRKDRPFVVVDCSAIPASLMESELFGHEKGSFSGAISGRQGLFELADSGTVFLDEVGELPAPLQPKLLRVLETGEFRRVGSSRMVRLDVRVIAATHRNLAREVEQGRFRQDLFYRLNVVPVRVPPLRERLEDLELLVGHILDRLAGTGMPDDAPRRLDSATLALLRRHPFPGNVRELVNVLQRYVSLGPTPDLDSDLLPADGTAAQAPEWPPAPQSPPALELAPFKDAKEEVVDSFEREYLERLLAATGSNLSQAARRSQLDRKHLRNLLRKHDLYTE